MEKCADLRCFRIAEARSAEQFVASWGKIPFDPSIVIWRIPPEPADVKF